MARSLIATLLVGSHAFAGDAHDPYAGYDSRHHRHRAERPARSGDPGFVVIDATRTRDTNRRTIAFDPITTDHLNTDSTRLVDARRLREARPARGIVRPENAVTVVDPAEPKPGAKAFLRPRRHQTQQHGHRQDFATNPRSPDTTPGWGRIKVHSPDGDPTVYEVNPEARPSVRQRRANVPAIDVRTRVRMLRVERLRAAAARDVERLKAGRFTRPARHSANTNYASRRLQPDRDVAVNAYVPADPSASVDRHRRDRSARYLERHRPIIVRHRDWPSHHASYHVAWYRQYHPRQYHPHWYDDDHAFFRYRRSVLLRHHGHAPHGSVGYPAIRSRYHYFDRHRHFAPRRDHTPHLRFRAHSSGAYHDAYRPATCSSDFRFEGYFRSHR